MVGVNKIFLWVGRIASLAFLIILAFVIVISIYSINYKDDKAVKANINNKNESLSLGEMEKISGTGLQLVELYSQEGKGISSGYSRNVRNILFVGKDMRAGEWLFPHNNYSITHNQLSINHNNDEKTRVIYYQVVKNHAESEGKLSEANNVIVALSKNDGTGYKEVITKLDKVIGISLTDDGKCISILYKKAEQVLYSCFNPESFEKNIEFVVTNISG